MRYGYTREVHLSFEEALDEIMLCLSEQGFGIMTKIDVQESMKKKLGKEVDRYMILGACNPHLAFEALQEDYEIGLIMPCNIIIYKKSNAVFVSTILPTIGIGFVENEGVQKIAKIAETKLKKAIDSTYFLH